MNHEPDHTSSFDESDTRLDENLDRRLTLALESQPAVHAADGFAARVLSRLPAQHPARLQGRFEAFNRTSLSGLRAVRTPMVGRYVSYAAVLILLTAMLLTAALPEGPAHVGATILEWSLAVEFILLTLWLTLRARTIG